MRSIDRTLLCALIAGLAPLAVAQAKLTVVADHGGQSARSYYAPIAGAGVDEQHAYSARAEAMSRGPVREADMLPVHSDRLSPGSVRARHLTLPAGMTPFFIIGADPLSLRWLKQRGDRLRDLHAVGLVVNVDSATQLKQLRRIGKGLVLRPVAGNDIAARLDLAHYPLLITPQGVQQ
ncbi:integrating conjugative element protein [Salinisphaera sp. T31B1]|uniref:Integrating conjugative element protein n=1 Tax=Salinisphaera aquimarina TaxID=2094031 RepID=A0ABV7EU23_9GAMM